MQVGSSPSHVTQTTTNQPPAYVQPYATGYLDAAGNLMMPTDPTTGQRTIGTEPFQQIQPLTDIQNAGIQSIVNLGMSNPYIQGSQNFLQNQMNQAQQGTVPESIKPG